MTTNDAALREKFEAWAKSIGVVIADPGVYLADETKAAWLAFQFAWQASAEAERGRVAKIYDGELLRAIEERGRAEIVNNLTPTMKFIEAHNHRQTLLEMIRTASPDPNLVRAQHPDGVPCSCEQCTARRLAAQQET